MQEWKQQIIDRLCLPHLSEDRFNSVWDKIDQKGLLAGTIDSLFYRALGVREQYLGPTSAKPWQNCAALWEFGDENYIGFLTKRHRDVYMAHSTPVTRKSQREAQIEFVKSLWHDYNPYAAFAVAYGHDCSRLLDGDIAGPPPKDPYERIAWLSYYWDVLTTGVSPLEGIRKDAKQDRFAVILPVRYEYILRQSPWLCQQVMSIFRPTGILIEKNHQGVLYHTTTHTDEILEDAGFTVSGDLTAHTFGGDVVYAYPNTNHKPTLRVTVKRYMESVFVEDKEDADQGECIFFPSDVISIERC